MEAMTWAAIIVCISQSGMLSGLNLAYFSISRLKLEVEAAKHNPHARRVQAIRNDANLLLATILWGNVAVNVLLALLSNSVMTGIAAFLFSTFVITFIGEIIPQAYFSRHALPMASRLAPVMWVYRVLLYPLAKPSAMVLDRWLGKESIQYYREHDFKEMINIHASSADSDIDRVEGRGAINFLALDDVPVSQEGEEIHPESIISIDFSEGMPRFPDIHTEAGERFLELVRKSGMKWAVLTDDSAQPRLALNTDRLLRSIHGRDARWMPLAWCHRPIVVTDAHTPLGSVIPRLKVRALHREDDVIDDDLIILWGEHKRIITGSDVLGRLLRGIVRRESVQGGSGGQ